MGAGGCVRHHSFLEEAPNELARLAGSAAIAGVGLLTFSPAAQAVYYSYGPLKAYEGSTYVASAKGNEGVDFTGGWVGGHLTSYDPRPGGSPAFAIFNYQYRQPISSMWSNIRGSNNYTAIWKDQAKYNVLDTSQTALWIQAKACQDDAWSPDACSGPQGYNFKW